MRTAAVLAAILLLGSLARSQDAQPAPRFPKAPSGFDDGRAEIEIDGASLTQVLGRQDSGGLAADRAELEEFVWRFLLPEELSDLDKRLKLDGGLVKCQSAADVGALFDRNKIDTDSVVRALEARQTAAGWKKAAVAAWLYARDVNCRAMLHAATMGSVPGRKTRQARADTAAELWRHAGWEYDLRDGTITPGGHYDGEQLVECLTALGWDAARWDKLLQRAQAPALTRGQKELLAWGDARRLWDSMATRLPESEFNAAMRAELTADDLAALRTLRELRSRLAARWFRTAGKGVVAVYSGPFPMPGMTHTPPVAKAADLRNAATPEDFMAGVKGDLARHFAIEGARLTLVIYEDGSGRAFIAGTGQRHNNPADTPLGRCTSDVILFEARVTLRGKACIAQSVFAGRNAVNPNAFEFVDMIQQADGSFLTANLDDGRVLTPILLRRVSRIVEVK